MWSSCFTESLSSRQAGTGTKQHIDEWNIVEKSEVENQIYDQLILQNQERMHNGKHTDSSINSTKNLDGHLQKHECRLFSYRRQKDKLNMNERPKSEAVTHQNHKGKYR